MGTACLPHEMETEQWLMVVHIRALATYAVSSSSLADPGFASHMVTAARQHSDPSQQCGAIVLY